MYEELYAQNKGLLLTLAGRWRDACERDRAVSVEDLTQAGFFGLVKAAQTYNPAAGKAWTSWAAWYIIREFETALCLREGHAVKPHTGALELDAPLEASEAESATRGDLLPDESLPEIDAGALLDELRQTVRGSVAQLRDEDQRRAVELYDLQGATIRETAEGLGVPVSRAYAIRQKAHSTLRKDKRLQSLAEDFMLDEQTRFHAHKGVAAFERDWTSVTEGAALWRVEQRGRRLPAGSRR